MAMTPPPSPVPSRSQTPEVFVPAMNALIEWLSTFVSEADAAVLAFNFNSTNTVSTTSLTIGVTTQNLTVETGKSFRPGQSIVCARTSDAKKWMRGEILSYDSGTGALSFDARLTNSSMGGPFTDWTISQAAVEGLVNYSEVSVNTANGHGSTNNKIPRFTTVAVNQGTAITYADSAANGASFTINEDGLYELSTTATYSGGACNFGASKNSAQLTTAIASITAANRVLLALAATPGAYNPATRTVKLVVGDVIRPHDDGTSDGASEPFQNFTIIKVANI